MEAFLYKTPNEEIHDEFRLWITAEPHPAFPIGLLQMGIKITNEAPVGMKAGLRNSYSWVSQDMMDIVARQEWRQLLFVMCFLHSVTQERRKFGPIGWNIPYEFNQSDLSACVQFLQNHLMEMDAKKAPAPTWETIRCALLSPGRLLLLRPLLFWLLCLLYQLEMIAPPCSIACRHNSLLL